MTDPKDVPEDYENGESEFADYRTPGMNNDKGSDPIRSSSTHSDLYTKPWLVVLVRAMPRVVMLIFMVLLFLWIYRSQGGLNLKDGWTEDNLFGYHALFMSLFVVVLMQEALLTWSVPMFESQHTQKVVHVLCHGLGLVFAIVGLVAIVKYKKLSPQPVAFPFFTCYTPHSWAAMVFLAFWGLQIIAKVTNLGGRMNKVYHRFFGNCIYAMGLAVCALGLQDMQSSDLAYSTQPMGTDDMSNMSNMTVEGYYPDSSLARLAAAGTIMLMVQGMATFFTQLVVA